MRVCARRRPVLASTMMGSILSVAAPALAKPPPVAHFGWVQVDPQAARSVTLAQLLTYADKNAPSIRTAVARVGQADAEVVAADFLLPDNPQLTLGAGPSFAAGDDGLNVAVALQQRLEVAGEPGLRLDAAKADRRVSLASVDAVRWAVHVEVHRLYVALLLAAERRSLAERFVSFSTALRDTAERQVAAGESSPLVRLVADSDLAQTRAALIEIEQFERATRTQLVATIGWPDDRLPPVVGVLPEVRRAPEPNLLLTLMLEHHPSIRVQGLAADARRAQAQLAEREAMPEPTVGLSYQRQSTPGPGDDIDQWMVNLTVPLPVARRAQGERALAAAEVNVADRHRAEVITELHGALIQAALALDAAADRVALYESDVMPHLEQNLTLLQRAYTLGEADVHQVSQTRERLLNATAQYLDARITYFKNAATLEGLVGTELSAERGGIH
jgi:cobalt-zinc-cadmium efflux system outer membrane protein